MLGTTAWDIQYKYKPTVTLKSVNPVTVTMCVNNIYSLFKLQFGTNMKEKKRHKDSEVKLNHTEFTALSFGLTRARDTE